MQDGTGEVTSMAEQSTAVGAPLRRIPQQDRGRRAVEAMLAATSELLEESGFDSLTTAAIADRAGVNIASLYRYFPNKFVIVRELAEGLEEERSAAAVAALRTLGDGADWRQPVREAVTAMAELRTSRPGARAIRRALQSSAELWHLDHDVNARTADAIAQFLVVVQPRLDLAESKTIALTVVTTVASLLDLVASDADQEAAVQAELLEMIEAYLEKRLGDEPAHS